MEVELRDDRVVREVGRGTVSFQRESRLPLRFRDVYYVLGLRKNLISVSGIEDRGFKVCFRDGCVYIHPRGVSFDKASYWHTVWEAIQVRLLAHINIDEQW